MSGLVVLGALALLAWGLLRGGRGTGTSVTTQAAHATTTARASRASTATAPQRASAGLRIRGTVVDTHDTPVAGVRVSASWPEPGQTLSELPCPEGLLETYEDPRDPSTRGQTLGQCMGHVTDLVLELVGAREGEAPVYAEATTGADGTFLLEALPEGPLALWALGEQGAVMRAGIRAGAEDVKLVLAEGLTLEGTVVGEGAPLAGATVTVLSTFHTRFFDTTTGADGHFRVGPLPSSRYLLFVAKDGWFPALAPQEAAFREVTLHRPGRLSGQVRSGGVPVPGTEVRVAPGKAIPVDTARRITADAEGRFSLVLPEGPYTLSAAREGRYALAHVTAGARAPEVVLELGSALHVEGTVSDDAGRPVAGARVVLFCTEDSSQGRQAVTDANGHYRLGPVEPGPASLTVEASGYLDLARPEPLTLTAAMEPVDFTLTRAATVTGRVTDAAGQRLPGLSLTFVRPGSADAPEDFAPQEGTWTDEDGRFVLDAEAPGDYLIQVDDKAFVDASFPVRAPSTDVHLTLRTGAAVEGTVVDSQGLPLKEFRVELQDPEGRKVLYLGRTRYTDAQGGFLIQGVEPGRYLLLASNETRGLARRAWSVVELIDGERARVQLRMAPERTLSGLVVDGQGRPVEGAYVRARTPLEDMPLWKREGRTSHHGAPLGIETDRDGRFTLRDLTEAAYDVRVMKDGYSLDAARSTGVQERGMAPWFRVGADTAAVRVVLTRQAHVVGRLVDPAGAPVRSFRVNGRIAKSEDGSFAVPPEDLENALLVFEADDLTPLVHQVTPRAGGADLDLGVLRMGRGHTVRGRVVDAETSRPLPSVTLMLAAHGRGRESVSLSTWRAGEDGTFELANMDPEAFTLTAVHAGYRKQHVTVDPGQEELTVRMNPGARVEVTVKDRQGRPRAARVEFEREDGSSEVGLAEQGRLVQRGLEPGPCTVRVESHDARKGRVLVFPPQHVQVPASGTLQLLFQEQEGSAPVSAD